MDKFIIIFDKTSPAWSKEYEYNVLYVQSNINYLKDLWRTRGYIYLNDIYEAFGVKWDPDKENYCWVYGRNDLKFGFVGDVTSNICTIVIYP